MSFKRMFSVIGTVHKMYGSPRILVFFDIIFCAFRYGVGYQDYLVFGFAKIHGKKQRSTFMTMNRNLSLVMQKNDPECFDTFNNKVSFNNKFKKFLGRDYIDISHSDADTLASFCSGKKKVFAKQTQTYGGQGIKCVHIDNSTDFKALFDELIQNKQYLIEDAIIQNDKMASLCESSVNTLRIVTVLNNEKPIFVYSVLRIGNGEKDVDNLKSGGMYAPINDKGVITKPAFCEKHPEYFETHPLSGTKIVGFKVPYFSQAVDMCLEAALVEPRMGYIGWDVAITNDGPVLVEGNNFPAYDMVQNYGHTGSGQGILPKFEELLGIKI